jgi:predicted XRE-type DNA-binding protein
MEARATIMMAVQKIVRDWEIPQHAAARKLGISQPRLNDLLRGKIDKFVWTHCSISVRMLG